MGRSAQNVCIALLLALPGLSGILPPVVLIACAPIALVAAFLLRPTPVQLSRATILSLVFIFCWLVAVWASAFAGGLTEAFPEDSLTAAARLSITWLLFLAAAASLSGRLPTVVQGFVVIGVLHSVISIFQFLIGGDALLIHGFARGSGVSTPNILANLLGLCLLCGAAIAFDLVEGLRPSRTNLAFMGIIIAGMLAAGTLKNLLVVCVLFVLLYLLGAKTQLPARITGAVATAALLIPALLTSDRVGARLSQATDVFSYFGIGSQIHVDSSRPSSILWRIEHWSYLIHDWYRNFFWMGSGIGQSFNMSGIRSVHGEGAVAHSDWVATIVEGGFVFSTLWLFTSFAAIYFMIRGIRSKHSRVIFFIILSYFALIMISGNVIYTSSFLYGFWILAGTLVAQGIGQPSATSARRIVPRRLSPRA